MTPMSVAVAGAGGVLIYCAVKGYDPRDVVKGALGGTWPPTVKYPIGDQPDTPDVEVPPKHAQQYQPYQPAPGTPAPEYNLYTPEV